MPNIKQESTTGRRYFSMVQNGTTADIDVYGEITSWPWIESDVSSYNLSNQLAEMNDVETINVNINSYGGEVAEGWAIYNALKRHSAKVVTRCDGFACSIASVIFSAGDERIMHDTSLLMIHNASIRVSGNSAELRKQADDLDAMNQRSRSAYMKNVNITEEELIALMDGESWISPQDALDMGFATSIEEFDDPENPSQSARHAAFERIMGKPKQQAEPSEPPAEPPAQKQAEPTEPPAEPEQDHDPQGEQQTEPAEPPAEPAEQKTEEAVCSFFLGAFQNRKED